MDSALSGAIAGGVVGGVLLVIVVAMVCYICFKRMYKQEDEKPSPRAPVMNGHVPNGAIPTVGQFVSYKPTPQPFTLRNHYQYTTMPVRQNITSYRPRYIEERNPVGEIREVRPEQQTVITTKSNTYNGPYASHTNGMVVYDVTRHKDMRSDRRPLWAVKSEEEAIATMVLDDEDSPQSTARIPREQNNNNSVKRESEYTTVDYVATKRLSRPEEIVIPSPDAKRKEHFFAPEGEGEESSHPSGQRSSSSANDRSHHSSGTEQEAANQRRRERRQRRGVEGSVLRLPPPDYDRDSQ